MADHITFTMGQFAARFPTDRQYSRNHMWFRNQAGVYRVGLAAYAVRLLRDVYFLDWSIEPNTRVAAKQEIGEIESSKANSGIYAPMAGTIMRFNLDLLDDPSAINVENYGKGWLFDFVPHSLELLTAHEYVEFLDSVWEQTQKLLKGQMHDDE